MAVVKKVDLERLVGCFRGLKLPGPAKPLPERSDSTDLDYRRKILQKLLELKTESIKLFRPLPHLAAFHTSRARRRVVSGSHRSSKTFGCAYEASVAFCGCDPFNKYPPTNGNALIVCLDLDQVAMIWRKLSQPGAFKIINDERTGLPRSVRPDAQNPLQLDPYDEAHRERWRDAPPLIPPRMLAGPPAWEDRRKEVPRYVKFVTGWRALFRSGDGKPPQGDHYNFGWLDEQIGNDLFIVELVRGLVALDEPPQWKPKMIWSATAQVTNPALTDMLRQAENGSPDVAAFHALIDDNPYVDAEEKKVYFDSLPEEERACRYYGIPAITGRYCYPTFDAQGIHGYDPFPIPADWCVYLWLDPGTQHCATLFLAVDPEEKHVWAYDGFDARVEDASDWARRVDEILGGRPLEAAGIDSRAGKENPFSAGMNVAERYWRALIAIGIKPRQVGPLAGFLPGCPEVAAREEALRSWLSLRTHGPFAGLPVLQVARGRLPKLEKQVAEACVGISQQSGRETRQTNRKRPQDLLDDLEYAAHYGATYFQPQFSDIPVDHTVWENFQKYRRRQRRQQLTDARQRFGHALEVG